MIGKRMKWKRFFAFVMCMLFVIQMVGILSVSAALEVTGVTLNVTTLTLEKSQTSTLTAMVLPESAPDKTVTFTSSDTAVATVSNVGLVTAVKAGSAIITVTTTDGAKTAQCRVLVLENVALNKSATTSNVYNSNSNYDASKAIDGSTSTFWMTDWVAGSAHYWQVDLGAAYAISRIEAYIYRSTTFANDRKNFEVLGSNTSTFASGTYTQLGVQGATDFNPSGSTATATWSASVNSENAYRYLRFRHTTTDSSNFILTEFRAIGRPQVSVTNLGISPSALQLAGFSSAQLTPVFTPWDVNNKKVTWSSSTAEIVSVDASGVVTANAEGTAVITATSIDGAKQATCTVTVPEIPRVPATGISINKNSMSLAVGSTDSLVATVHPVNAISKSVRFNSQVPEVATVNEEGVVTAKNPGTTIITATSADGLFQEICTVTVNAPVVDSNTNVALNKPSYASSLVSGYASFTIANGNDGNHTSAWASTYTSGQWWMVDLGGAHKLSQMQLFDRLGSSVNNRKNFEIQASNDLAFLANQYDVIASQGDVDLGSGYTYVWPPTPVPTVAPNPSASPAPTVAPVKVPTDKAYRYIRYKKVGSELEAAFGELEVYGIPVIQNLSLNKSNVTLALDAPKYSSEKLVPIFQPIALMNRNVTWSIQDASIAAVDADGVVSAKKAGETVLTAVSEDGGLVATCAVKVVEEFIHVESITLPQTQLTMIDKEQRALTSPTIYPQNAMNKKYVWFSDNGKVLGVSQSGVLKINSVGTANISVITDDGKVQATIAVTVLPKSVTGVQFDRSTTTLALNGASSRKITSQILPADATNPNVHWASSDEGVATVDDEGNVHAVSTGTTEIRAITEDGGFIASCQVTVIGDNIAVSGIALSPAAVPDLQLGHEQTFSPVFLPENATNQFVTWTSDDASIASVDSHGKVKGNKVGKTNIKVISEDGNKTAVAIVTVIPIRIAGTSNGTTFQTKPGGQPSDDKVTYHVTTATLKSGQLIQGTDFTVTGLPSGLSVKAMSYGISQNVEFSLTGTPATPLAAQSIPFQIVLKASLATTTMSDSYPINYTMAVPQSSGSSSSGGGGSSGGGVSVPLITPIPQKVTEPQDDLTQPQSITFKDIEIPWAKTAIKTLAKKEIIKGTAAETFAPMDNITRAQFVTLVVRAFDLKEKAGETSEFSDVSKDTWYQEYVKIGASNGIIQGTDGYFYPNENLTREQMAVILLRTMKMVDPNGELKSGDQTYSDASSISDWAKDAVNILSANELIQGSENRFEPLTNANRAQTAVILYRILNYLKKL